MTYGEFKSLGYPDSMPMEACLVNSLLDGKINYQEINAAYTSALEMERHRSKSKFNEAATCILQLLSGNFDGKDEREKLNKRCVHIYNECGIFPKHIYDCKYGYTKEDERNLDNFCNGIYGNVFNHEKENEIK